MSLPRQQLGDLWTLLCELHEYFEDRMDFGATVTPNLDADFHVRIGHLLPKVNDAYRGGVVGQPVEPKNSGNS